MNHAAGSSGPTNADALLPIPDDDFDMDYPDQGPSVPSNINDDGGQLISCCLVKLMRFLYIYESCSWVIWPYQC